MLVAYVTEKVLHFASHFYFCTPESTEDVDVHFMLNDMTVIKVQWLPGSWEGTVQQHTCLTPDDGILLTSIVKEKFIWYLIGNTHNNIELWLRWLMWMTSVACVLVCTNMQYWCPCLTAAHNVGSVNVHMPCHHAKAMQGEPLKGRYEEKAFSYAVIRRTSSASIESAIACKAAKTLNQT